MKTSFFYPPISKITLALIIPVMILVSSNINWGKNKWVDIIESDAKGYYAYLPAIFIYHDLNFGFFDKIEKEKYYNKNLYYDYRSGANGKVINKYYCGTALAEMPFFLLAHFIASFFGFEADGYSMPYPVLISIGALFYLFIGLLYLRNTLALYGIGEWQKSLILLSAVFGTNLFYYTIGEPGMSHVFSFAFISMFVFYSKKYFIEHEKKTIVVLALISGMVVLIRPVNLLVFSLLPFLAGSYGNLKQGVIRLFKEKNHFILSLVAFAAIISIQLLVYKISTGNFMIYSYGGENFDFFAPHITDILFSYKKGLFLYTPVYLLSLTGLFFFGKSSTFEFCSWLFFFILITWVFSSWWMWYYGGSFSSRVYVEYIPAFMILLAVSLEKIELKTLKYFFVSIIVFLIIVCQVQTYQYRYYQIHWSEMTKEKYRDAFLRIDRLIK